MILQERDYKALKLKEFIEHPSFNFIYMAIDKKIKDEEGDIIFFTQRPMDPKSMERFNIAISRKNALTGLREDLVDTLKSLADDEAIKFADIPSAYTKGSNSKWRIKWMNLKTLIKRLRLRLP